MLIDLSELLSTSNKDQTYEVSIEMNELDVNGSVYLFNKKEPVMLNIRNVDRKKILVEAKTSCSLNIPCDRCLNDVEIDFDIDFSKTIDMSNDLVDEEDRDDFAYIVESNLDVDKLVYNEVLVNMPMKVLCDDNCKGICNRCGANLNLQQCDCDRTELDPRMSKILDVFNNFKEV